MDVLDKLLYTIKLA